MSARTAQIRVVMDTILQIGLLVMFAVNAFTGDTHGVVVAGFLLLLVFPRAWVAER